MEMPSMEVTTSFSGGTAIIAVKGRLDAANASQFGQELDEVLAGDSANMVIDCRDLRYMSSAGLRVVLIAIRKTNAKGGGLALSQVSRHIQEVMDVSGFSRLAKSYATNEEAVRKLS